MDQWTAFWGKVQTATPEAVNPAGDQAARVMQMARKELELELLTLRYKQFTAEVRKCISHVMRSERCEDTSDKVIDELWQKFPDEIDRLLAESDVEQPHSVQDGSAPTYEAREFIRKFIDQALSYEAELGELADDNFEDLYRSTFDPIEKARRERRVQAAREIDRWDFFNKPNADADFVRWRGRLLAPAQAVALSFGKDPDVVKPARLEPYRRVARSLFREAFKDRLDLIEAAVAAGELTDPMSVSSFAMWANANGLRPPAELTGEASESIKEGAAAWKAKYEAAQSALEKLRQSADDMSPKSRTSIYMMIIAMAIARFEHKTVGNTKSTSAIKRAVEDLNVKIDDDTILGHLRDAASLLAVKQSEVIPWSEKKRPKS